MNNLIRAIPVLALFLIIPGPFFRGLFFEPEMGIHHFAVAGVTIFTAGIILFRQWHSRHPFPVVLARLARSPCFWALAGLAFAYLLAFWTAVNSREALFAWLRHLDYLLAFVLVFLATGITAQNQQPPRLAHWLLVALAITGTLVAAAGIMAGLKLLPLASGVVNGRLAATFQYPNTFAAYLLASFTAALYLATRSTRLPATGLYYGMSLVMLLGILGSQSRAVWLLLPFVLTAAILGFGARKKAVLLTAATGIFALALSFGTLTPAITPGQNGNPLLARAAAIQLGSGALQERLVIYSDALRMVRERPLTGWGGGGWMSAYSAYQSYPYQTAYVHNHFLQVAVETGVIGFTAFATSVAWLGISLCRLFRRRRELSAAQETWTCGVIAGSLVLHAAVDFDFSFSSISLLYWALLAVFSYQVTACTPAQEKVYHSLGGRLVPLVTGGVLLVLALRLVLLTADLRTATVDCDLSETAAKQGNTAAALECLQAAACKDPWETTYLTGQAQLLLAAATYQPPGPVREALTTKATGLVIQATALDQTNAQHYSLLARLYLEQGRFSEACAAAEKANHLQPWLITTYEDLAAIYLQTATNQVENVVTEVLAKETSLATWQALYDPRRKSLTLTPRLALIAGKAALLQNDPGKAVSYLSRKGVIAEADESTRLWLVQALEKAKEPSP
ncbi:MAG: O-antigen ligase family protein [Heliobacteriaceae bacterium]|nr:O-antigen ligase family protein [Heliobacteriaceae bacterium]